MGQQRERRRFRINPVELIIFGAVTLIFANSVYQLIFDWEEIRGTVSTLASLDKNLNGRSLASSNPLFATIEVKCNAPTKKKSASPEELTETTDAVKARILGPFCAPAGVGKNTFSKVEVLNKTSNSSATVISNANEGHFSTDFIPLNAGKNQILIKWLYQGGREFSQVLNIQKKTP